MKKYLDLLEHVLNNGTVKSDRTGTGTISLFGHQTRYDLSEGFPLVTTKKCHLKSIIHELLWFLRGDTNIRYLKKNGVRIWDEWADENGDLGAIYGSQWRFWEVAASDIGIVEKREPIYFDVELSDYIGERYCGIGYDGDLSSYDQESEYFKNIKATWQGIISEVNLLGDVTICTRWHCLANFLEDITTIPGYVRFLTHDYKLDPFYYGANQYAPHTCIFIPKDVDYNDNKKDINGNLLRPIFYVDQISRLIETIKTDRDSRRMIVSAWNASDMNQKNNNRAALDSCHSFMQFYVNDNKLSCQLYQRSADLFLGVPFNIASYALFTMMIAHVTGLDVGEFVHTIGDAHIYNNHIDQVKLQLSREPFSLPVMKINKNVNDIFSFTYDDFVLENYVSHDTIKAKVAK